MNENLSKLYKSFIYLMLVLLSLSIVVPVIWVFLSSLKQNYEFFGSPWALPESFYFNNFIEAWNRAEMGSFLFNSIFVTFFSLVILLGIGVPAAYVLTRYDFPGKRLLNQYIRLGLFINVSYIVVPIFLLLVDWSNAFTFMPNFLNNRIVLSVVLASTALPFTINLLSGHFETLSTSFEEAAIIDGASHFQIMTKVMIPLAKPSIITVILFNSLAFWNEYILSFTLLSDNTSRTLPVGLRNLMAAQFSKQEYGQLYAGMVIVMLPSLIFYILLQKQLTMGTTEGGNK